MLIFTAANKQKKQGAGSPAQVRKNFARHVDLFVDAGDLAPADPSTVIDFQDGQFEVTRAGALSDAEITTFLNSCRAS